MVSTFLANVYEPPDSGNAVDISEKLETVRRAIRPFKAKARIALGPGRLKGNARKREDTAADDCSDAEACCAYKTKCAVLIRIGCHLKA